MMKCGIKYKSVEESYCSELIVIRKWPTKDTAKYYKQFFTIGIEFTYSKSCKYL